jgi:hypothetical protein
MEGSPWEQMPMSNEQQAPGGMGGIMAGMGQLDDKKKENLLDELIHNYILMPQMSQAREQLKQSMVQQYMQPQGEF